MWKPQKGDLWALLVVLLMIGVIFVSYGPQFLAR